MSETAKHADVVLPGTTFLEKDGTSQTLKEGFKELIKQQNLFQEQNQMVS